MGGGFLEGHGILLLMLAMAAVVIADVIGHALRVHHLGRLRDEENLLIQLKEDRRRQIETQDVQRASIVAQEQIVATLEQRLRWVRDEIEIELGQALTVEHEIGSRGKTRSRFRIRLLSTAGNGARKGASGAEGTRLGQLHPEIARLPNFALVWAGSQREALHRFGVAFPAPIGVSPDAPVNLDRGSGGAEASEEIGDDAVYDDATYGAEGGDAPSPLDAVPVPVPGPVAVPVAADLYRETGEPASDADRSMVR